MPVQLTWIAHASFRIAGERAVAYIDPWKLADQPHDADVVIVSHGHHDHCSSEDVAKVSAEATVVLAPADTAGAFAGGRVLAPGDTATVGSVTAEAVPAYNIGKAFHPKANGWIGVVLTVDGRRIYYAGDTDHIPEMGDLEAIDLALLPVGGTYTMDADEAAAACRDVGCAAAIGYHWGEIIGSAADAKRFADAADCPVHLLQPGESITL
jgi:L-ascorbate metabolism protein UlaG (beta-lactamase superfamily)